MKTTLALVLSFVALTIKVQAEPPAVTALELKEADQTHVINLKFTVDDVPYTQYWTKTFDALFAFADTDQDGLLSKNELSLVPSARAVRLSLGNAFTPPVAPIESMTEITGDTSKKCDKQQLHDYYWRNGAGRLQIGAGKLPNTAALTEALIKALDADQDGLLSKTEIEGAASALKRLDTNDDELIGVGELVPNATYPGNWAAQALSTGAESDLSSNGDGSLILKRVATPEGIQNKKHTAVWQISLGERISALPLKMDAEACCESWSIPGPMQELFTELSETIANSDPNSPQETTEQTSRRDRRPDRSWLTPLADRDGNGTLTQAEIDQWLALQKQLIQGQALIGVYSGGGLFELLDANHDAGLSLRELKTMWQRLEKAECTSGNRVELNRVPHVVLFVVSQGYPETLAKVQTSEIEWFQVMDRNRDSDVSRREFTGSPAAFDKLDLDHDGLISPEEAGQVK